MIHSIGRRLLIPAILSLCCWPAHAPAADGGPKIGVVNITKVFESYKRKRALEEDLRSTREQKTRVIREKETELKQIVDELQMLDLGSEQRKNREADLEKKQVDLRSFTEVTAGNLAVQKREVTEALYTEIVKAIADYGKKNGFDLIIKYEDVEIKSDSLDQLLYKINQRSVLYTSDAVDITQEVIGMLNKGQSGEIVEK